MCLAIGSGTPRQRSGLGRLWWRLADSPARLFAAGAFVHSILITVLIAYLLESGAGIDRVAMLALMAGIGSLFAFGPLLQRFPQWADRYAIHYVAYSSTFLSAFAGLLCIELYLLSGRNLLPAGIALLVVSLMVGLRSLWSIYGWLKAYRRRQAQLAISSLALTGLLLTGLLLSSVI